ncbi:MAG: ParB/Srx family N-terminal domain-containing protein [Flavobacteriales bacterium]
MDEFFLKQEQNRKEFARLRAKAEEYNRQIVDGEFKLDIEWELDISRIDLADLRTSLNDELRDRLDKDFLIRLCDLDKLLVSYCENPDKTFPTNSIWGDRQPADMARLVEFVESGNKLYPPIIRPLDASTITILDGHHRIALSRFLRMSEIPILLEITLSDLIPEILV